MLLSTIDSCSCHAGFTVYSGGTVTRSEPKVIKPLKGEIGGTGIRSPRVGGQGGMGGISGEIKEIGKSAKGRGIGGCPPGPLGARSLRDPRKSQV